MSLVTRIYYSIGLNQVVNQQQIETQLNVEFEFLEYFLLKTLF